MKIIKHGTRIDHKRTHIDLHGKCAACGCEFKTFLDIYRDLPNKGDLMFVTDPSCTDMMALPEFVYGDGEWQLGPVHYTHSREIRGIRSIDCSCPCPECGACVELKIIAEGGDDK